MDELDNLSLTYFRSKYGPLDSIYLMLWKIKGFLYSLNDVSMDYTLKLKYLPHQLSHVEYQARGRGEAGRLIRPADS